MNFIAVDFETANSNRSSICSLGLAVVDNGRIVKTEHIFVKPTPNYYDSFNSLLHGITDWHTRDQKTFQQHWKEVKSFFHNQTIVAHNAAFDCSVLRYTLDTYKLKYPDLNYHCTYRLSQEMLNLGSHKLNVVSNHFNIKLNHHNAESDAIASALIAIKLCELQKVNSLEELSKSVGFKIGKIMSEGNDYRPFSKK